MAKVAVVTGASRGIGRAIALDLAGEGFDIVVAARTETPRRTLPGTIHKTVEDVQALGRRALAVKADLGKREEVDGLIQQTIATLGRVDVLVNNAAYTGSMMFLSFWDLTPESWEMQIFVNLTTPFLLSKGFAPHMREQGGGIIVNITSGAGRQQETEGSRMPGAGGTTVAYPTSKAALDRMTLALAKELRPFNISIVSVDPGFVLTENAETYATTKGLVLSTGHPMAVPARTVSYLATCTNPMWYTGKVLVAKDFVQEHNLF